MRNGVTSGVGSALPGAAAALRAVLPDVTDHLPASAAGETVSPDAFVQAPPTASPKAMSAPPPAQIDRLFGEDLPLRPRAPMLPDALRTRLETNAHRWHARQGVICTSSVECRGSGIVKEHYSGIPPEVRAIAALGVYRHYVQTPGELAAIVASSELLQGPTPCWRISGNAQQTYGDLRGIFLTRPDVRPEPVGCPAPAGFVDLLLAPETPLFLVPLYSGVRDEVFVIPGASLRDPDVRVTVTIVGSSAKEAWPPSSTLDELLTSVADAPLPSGLDALCFTFGNNWKRVAEASGLGRFTGSTPPPDLLHHGLPHLLRTAFLAVRLGLDAGLPIDAPEMRALWYAGLFHDYRRARARDDASHAEDSAQWAEVIMSRNEVDPAIVAMAARAIRDHVRLPTEVDAPLSRILRDADALERFRLAPDGCDGSFLTSAYARSLMPLIRSHYHPAASGSG